MYNFRVKSWSVCYLIAKIFIIESWISLSSMADFDLI
jgi:hypothetical protein